MSNTVSSDGYFCAGCEDKIEPDAHYKCNTCTDNAVEAVATESFCDSCIPWHLKKGHSIVDWKGFEPAVCSDHKQLCLEYCVTCELIFCSKCLGNHRMHDFKPLHEKAGEVRSQIHQYLADWETNEKHILKKRAEITRNVEGKKKTAENLMKQLKEKTKKLDSDITGEIVQKLSGFEKMDSSVQEHGRKITDLQAHLRSNLGRSNGPLVSAFRSCKKANDDLAKLYLQFVNFKMNPQNFQYEARLDNLFKGIFDQIKSLLILPQVAKPAATVASHRGIATAKHSSAEQNTFFIAGCFTEKSFIVRQHKENIVSIYRYVESGPEEHVKTFNLGSPLQRIFFQNKFVLLQTEKTVHIYDVAQWNCLRVQDVTVGSSQRQGLFHLSWYYSPNSQLVQFYFIIGAINQ